MWIVFFVGHCAPTLRGDTIEEGEYKEEIRVVTITEKAAEKIKALRGDDPAKGLRIKIVGGGCSGLHYKMEFDAPGEKDKVFEEHGAKVIVDRKSFLYLINSTLDYREELASSGFVITNPNTKRTCGCGESFSV